MWAPVETYAKCPREEYIDGMMDQLMGSNERTHGGGPPHNCKGLVAEDSWGESHIGRGSEGSWTRRIRAEGDKDRAGSGRYASARGDKMPPSLLRGGDGMEEASFRRMER